MSAHLNGSVAASLAVARAAQAGAGLLAARLAANPPVLPPQQAPPPQLPPQQLPGQGLPSGQTGANPLTAPAAADTFPAILLTCVLASTLLAAVAVMCLPERTEDWRGRLRITALAGSGLSMLLAIGGLNYQISQGTGGGTSTYEETRNWFSGMAISSLYHLRADGISVTLLVLSTVIFTVAVLATWRVHRRLRLFLALLLVIETGANGVLLAQDWLLLLMFWGMTLVPLWLLIRVYAGTHAARAAGRFGGVAMGSYALVAAVAMVLAFKANQNSYDFDRTNSVALINGLPDVGFWLLLGALCLAAGVVPVHRWLVDAIAESPPAVSAVIGGVLMQLPLYLVLRLLFTAFPDAAKAHSLVIVGIGVLTTVWAAVAALGQGDLRRMIAYSAVSRSGVVLFALGAQTNNALDGAVLMLCANGLSTALLLLIAGSVQERTRTLSIHRLGGLLPRMPKLGGLWIFAVLAAAGVPLLPVFAADFEVLTGAYPAHRIATLVIALAIAFSSGVLLWAAHRVLFGAPREEDHRVRDATALDWFVSAPLVVAVLLFGIVPGRVVPLIHQGVLQDVLARLSGAG